MDTVLAALIGAVLGSLGSPILVEFFRRRRTREALYRQAVDRYLLQLQDAVTSLRARSHNILERGGRDVMSNEYYRSSTAYALGCVLAQKRRLMLDGIYAQLEGLESNLGSDLSDSLEELEHTLGSDDQFQRYERLALAESVMERTSNGWATTSYLEFLRKWRTDDSVVLEDLLPTDEFLRRLPRSQLKTLRDRLDVLGRLLAMHTHLPFRPADGLQPGEVPDR